MGRGEPCPRSRIEAVTTLAANRGIHRITLETGAANHPARALIPACNLLVVDDSARVLLQRRRDTGQWALPGRAQDLGETPSQCAARECEEETGIIAEVEGLLEIFSDPQHIVRYADGETRQQFEITLIGRPSKVCRRPTTMPARSAGSPSRRSSDWTCTPR